MGQIKNMLIEYIECMIAAGSHHTFEELQNLVMVDGSVEKAAFFDWYDAHGTVDMVKDGKVLTTEKEYSKKLRKYSDEKLEYVMTDALRAAEAMPDGKNAGFYAAEARLCQVEIDRREALLWADIESQMLGG